MSEYYARLKPFDPKRDNAMRVFVCGQQRFDEAVWVPVDKQLASELRQVHQSYYDDRSPLAFDVCTLEQAIALGFTPPREPSKIATSSEPPQDPRAEGEALGSAPSRPKKKDS